MPLRRLLPRRHGRRRQERPVRAAVVQRHAAGVVLLPRARDQRSRPELAGAPRQQQPRVTTERLAVLRRQPGVPAVADALRHQGLPAQREGGLLLHRQQEHQA